MPTVPIKRFPREGVSGADEAHHNSRAVGLGLGQDLSLYYNAGTRVDCAAKAAKDPARLRKKHDLVGQIPGTLKGLLVWTATAYSLRPTATASASRRGGRICRRSDSRTIQALRLCESGQCVVERPESRRTMGTWCARAGRCRCRPSASCRQRAHPARATAPREAMSASAMRNDLSPY